MMQFPPLKKLRQDAIDKRGNVLIGFHDDKGIYHRTTWREHLIKHRDQFSLSNESSTDDALLWLIHQCGYDTDGQSFIPN